MEGITILLDTLDKLHFTVKTKDNDKTEHAEVCTFQSTVKILFHANSISILPMLRYRNLHIIEISRF